MPLSSVPPPKPAAHINSLQPYEAGKPIAEVKRELGLTDVVKLASNENPLGPSPRAIQAISGALANLHLYPEGSCPELRRVLAGYLSVNEDELIFGNGSDELIHLIGITFLEEGDEVLQAVPTFVRYEAAAVLNRAKCVSVPMKDWAYDFNALITGLSDRTRLIFLPNPNNPTGAYLSTADVERLLASIPPRCIVCFDEAYYEYVDAADFPVALDYVRSCQNVIVLRTFSKVYGLAGLRIGYGVARPEIVDALNRVREPFNVNSLAQVAAAAALEDDDHRRRSKEMTAEGRTWLTAALGEIGVRAYPSQANFLWVDTGRDGRKLFQALLHHGVIVRTGDIFGAPTFLRITVGTQRENERLIQALKEVTRS